MYVHDFFELPPQMYKAPSSIDKSLFKTNLFSSIIKADPSPLHSSQAPNGALNENSLGTILGNSICSCSLPVSYTHLTMPTN